MLSEVSIQDDEKFNHHILLWRVLMCYNHDIMDPSALSVDILLSLCDSSSHIISHDCWPLLRFPIVFEAYDVMHILLIEEPTRMM